MRRATWDSILRAAAALSHTCFPPLVLVEPVWVLPSPEVGARQSAALTC